MKILKVKLRKGSIEIPKLLEYREQAKKRNLLSGFSKEMISKLNSPNSGKSYSLEGERLLVSSSENSVPIKNGIPDFTIFSTNALDEKEKQASYHDDEEINETFEEIVFRPYQYTEFFAEIWLKHLYDLVARVEKISGRSFDSFSILNCGCGGGFEAQFFAEQGARVVGFDISQLRAEASATRFALNNLEGFFYRGDAAILPFRDNSFDIVLYHDSLHHVPIEEIPISIKEARRVAKEFIILSEAHDSPLRLILESLGKSTSIEESGNYTFRFKKSLIQFWCKRFGMKLLLYRPSFMKREHKPRLYGIPVLGTLLYRFFLIIGFFLQPFGNEALIIMEKTKNSD